MLQHESIRRRRCDASGRQEAARVKAAVAVAVDQESPTYEFVCDMSQIQEVIILPLREGGRDYLPQPIVLRPGNHLGKWKPPRMRTMYTRVLALLDLSSLL